MRFVDTTLVLSPTDLSSFLTCRHRTGLDLAVAAGALERPTYVDPFAATLQRLGEEHERRYVESLRARGLHVVDLGRPLRMEDDQAAQTVAAMREGVDAIVQARLENGDLAGYADVLLRVDRPSNLGDWSYEAQDTKLARETKGGTILQLTAYSVLLAELQGCMPERFHVVTPAPVMPVQTYRVDDYIAYYRMVLGALRDVAARGHEALVAAHYPEPVEACEVCRWWERCNARRRADDHPSFIAGAGRLQRSELTTRGLRTLAEVAAMPLPIAFTPARGSRDTYVAIREQARLQHEQRTAGEPRWTLLPVQPDVAVEEQGAQGLRRLPAPSRRDLFLDLEGARFAREGGREYLFGVWGALRTSGTDSTYVQFWATTDAEERAAFEAVVDSIVAASSDDPGMHVYHFGHYEQTAFKRLMGRHATRADEIDRLLRAGRFVDLHAVVRQALRAGVETYSIKQLEPFTGYTRAVPLRHVRHALLATELALESGVPAAITDEVRSLVSGYNEDDCRSTAALRGWLEALRAEVEAGGTPVSRPVLKEGDASEKVTALQAEVEQLRARLLDGVPEEPSQRTPVARARWLLAYLIDWHRRADKAEWWEFYRLCELAEDDLLDERRAVAGLNVVERVDRKLSTRGTPTGTVTDRYRYPEQDLEVGSGDELKLQDGSRLGSVRAIDRLARTIDIEKGRTMAERHPRAAFAHKYIDPTEMQRAIMRLAGTVLDTATAAASSTLPLFDPALPRRCGIDLLFQRAPQLKTGRFERLTDETDVACAIRLVGDLDATTLAIQGPPGAGKTYTGAQMIRALVQSGKRVGVTANSHKVIVNLLEEVRKQSTLSGEVMRLGRKVSADASDADGSTSGMCEFTDNPSPLAALQSGEIDVLGGTPFLWARAEYAGSVDVLFVDEAGQMSLANALAVSQAGESLVLLGDPQQLEQPQKGSHPDGVSVSALEHVLDGAMTMPSDRGLFLPMTWRLAPDICAFTSEAFYEGKLHPKEGLAAQRLVNAGVFDGVGLWLVPVEHDGNQNASVEEVDAVHAIVSALLSGGGWIDEREVQRPLLPADFRIVAPYNAQVNRLTERLAGRAVPVGTVDKFQGQEAPVVIYSMATSRPEDAPRGMEFLYSLNRLNVATSRARCAVILVASARLFEPECRTPRQMQLANALCRYREMARVVTTEAVGA